MEKKHQKKQTNEFLCDIYKANKYHFKLSFLFIPSEINLFNCLMWIKDANDRFRIILIFVDEAAHYFLHVKVFKMIKGAAKK